MSSATQASPPSALDFVALPRVCFVESMGIYRILAIVWFATYCFVLFESIRRKLKIAPPRYLDSNDSIFSFWIAAWIYMALIFIGIAASVLLFIGVEWALWIIGLGAIGHLLSIGCTFVFGRRFGIRLGLRHLYYLSISTISLVLLFGWRWNVFHF